MRQDRHVAVVGAGQAAARSIAAMREAGFDGPITLFGEESEHPYERPPLSKEALFGREEPRPATIFNEQFYQDQCVHFASNTRVTAIDAVTGAISLGNGSVLKANRILMATGARPRAVSIPGVDANRILMLRNMADTRRVRPLLLKPCRVVLIGGGFIGLEIAAGAARAGCRVTLIEAGSRLMARAVSPMVSELFRQIHGSHGVRIITDRSVVSARQGEFETELTLSDGTSHVADVIVGGIGALPNVELAKQAGIECGDGIHIDGNCRTDSPIVWAAGDVAARVHPFCGVRTRFESWKNAEVHAARAGRSIAASWSGESCPSDFPTDTPPWFWTDQYDVNLQILGCITDGDKAVVRKAENDMGMVIFHFHGTELRGAELFMSGRDRTLVKRLIQQRGGTIAPEKFADLSLSLKDLSTAAKAAPQPGTGM